MKIKQLILPIVAGMGSFMFNASAQAPEMNMQTTTATTKSALAFVENKGQVTDQFYEYRTDIDFKMAAGNGLNIFFGKGKIYYQWSERIKSEQEIAREASGLLHLDVEETEEPESSIVDMYRMDVELIGSNPNPKVIAEGRKSFFERYFLSWVNKDNNNEGVKVHAYEKIIYKDIYPNIDWVFYINNKQQVEHDFIVHPNGKVSDIQIKYSGSIDLNIEENGSLFATTPKGSIKENAPYSFDESGQEVASKFILNNNILSFEVSEYSGTLTIDPILEWGTYFGGSDDDKSFDLAMDKFGDIYMAGGTNSASNIATTGTHETTFQGGNSFDGGDAFLSKWNADGDLLWATYYGGTGIDIAKGVDCDTSGNIYLGGSTSSFDGISTIGSYQEVRAGTQSSRTDAFLIRFDSSGVRQWGTYFGGSSNDAQTSFALACDKFNNIYITGNTYSSSDISTSNAYQSTLAGGDDVFIAKFDINGIPDWATYYGGPSNDFSTAITVDSIGDIYLTGYTQSTTSIATVGTHQEIHAGGYDAFITKFNQFGNLIWGTYFGGNLNERSWSIKYKNNTLVIVGYTTSNNGIATINAHQEIYGEGQDGYIAQFTTTGNLEWSTYYGGTKTDGITNLDIDNNNNIIIAGYSESTSAIATLGSFKENMNSIWSVFFAKFNTIGERIWGSYYGGSNINDQGLIITDNNYNFYLGGITSSANEIATSNGYQSSLNGGEDAFLVKFNNCPKPELDEEIEGEIEICANAISIYEINEAELAGEYVWILPSGWTGESNSNSIEITIGNDDGILQVYAISSCGGISDTLSLEITVLPVPEPVIVNNNNILSISQAYNSYQWMKDGVDIIGETNPLFTAVENGAYQVRVTENNECVGISDEEIIDGVGINHIDFSNIINIYPNPAKEILFIESMQKMSGSILSLDGRVLKVDINISIGLNSLEIQELASGMYFLKLKDEKGETGVRKFIVE